MGTRLFYGAKDLDRAVAAIGQHDDLAVLSSAQARVLAQAVFQSTDLTPASDGARLAPASDKPTESFWYVVDRARALAAMREAWDGRVLVTSSPEGHCEALLNAAIAVDAISVPSGSTSDGFHTFDELYQYRLLYNAAFFNAVHFFLPHEYEIHKSRRHDDGEFPFGDPEWFIVVAQLPTGQVTNHYRTDAWDLFQIAERDKAAAWDGHTPAEAASRLWRFVRGDWENGQ